MDSQASYRIIFVPGVKPKPPPEVHRERLLLCLLRGLEEAAPAAHSALSEDPSRFELCAWNFEAYGEHRDTELDRAGLERLLESPQPSPRDLVDIKKLARHTSRIVHVLGDRYPLLGRRFAPARLRESLSDARGYLRDVRGLATQIRESLKAQLRRAWLNHDRVIVIGHSLGSVIAYDTFWELSHENADSDGSVALFVTLGSPLSTRFVSHLIKGADKHGSERYPTNIERWENFSALGETVEFFPPLGYQFSPMIKHGLIDAIEDHTGLFNPFRGPRGLNVHVSYGYLVQPAVAQVIGSVIVC